MEVTEHEWLQAEALQMTHHLARHLRDPQIPHQPQYDLPSAVGLIHNYVYRFNQPALAVQFALHFHSTVEIWAEWGAWAETLDTLLGVNDVWPPDRMQLFIFRSRAARGVGDHVSAITYSQTALRLAEAYQSTVHMVGALNQLGRIAFEQDDYGLARMYLERANRLHNEKTLPSERGFTTINLGNIAVQQGQLSDAHHYFKEAIDYYNQQGDALYIAKTLCNIANLYIREKRFEEARREFVTALETLRQIHAPFSYALAQNDLGCMYLSNEQWDLALDAFTTAISELDSLGSLSTKSWVMTNLIELYVTTGQYEKAKSTINEAYYLADLCKRPLVTAGIKFDHGRLLVSQGDTPGARQLWIQALEIQERRGAFDLAKRTRELLEKLPPPQSLFQEDDRS